MARTTRGTGEDNRRKILEAAMDLIARDGVANTSLAMISKASGLSKGTLYYYYASKNELIFDIADLHMERITEAILATATGENGTTSWKKLLTAYFQVLLSADARSRLHLYLIREAVSGNTELRERFRETYGAWFSLVDENYVRVTGDTLNVHAKSKFLVAVVDGFILQGLLDVERTDIADIVDLATKLVES